MRVESFLPVAVATVLIASTGCVSLNVAFGSGTATRDRYGGNGPRLAGGAGVATKGEAVGRVGAGIQYRVMSTGSYSVYGGGLELRGDLMLAEIKPDRRLSLALRSTFGWASVGPEESSTTRGFQDYVIGVSYDALGDASYVGGQDVRRGAGLVTLGLAITRIPMDTDPTLWIIGGQVELTGVIDLPVLFERL